MVEPTHLKNMQPSNRIISPIFGVKIKNMWNHHLEISEADDGIDSWKDASQEPCQLYSCLLLCGQKCSSVRMCESVKVKFPPIWEKKEELYLRWDNHPKYQWNATFSRLLCQLAAVKPQFLWEKNSPPNAEFKTQLWHRHPLFHFHLGHPTDSLQHRTWEIISFSAHATDVIKLQSTWRGL